MSSTVAIKRFNDIGHSRNEYQSNAKRLRFSQPQHTQHLQPQQPHHLRKRLHEELSPHQFSSSKIQKYNPTRKRRFDITDPPQLIGYQKKLCFNKSNNKHKREERSEYMDSLGRKKGCVQNKDDMQRLAEFEYGSMYNTWEYDPVKLMYL